VEGEEECEEEGEEECGRWRSDFARWCEGVDTWHAREEAEAGEASSAAVP